MKPIARLPVRGCPRRDFSPADRHRLGTTPGQTVRETSRSARSGQGRAIFPRLVADGESVFALDSVGVLRETCHITRYLPAGNGASRGTTSCFLSLRSTAGVPVAIDLPLSSRNSRPENLAITPSEKFRRISLVVGAARAIPSAGGAEDVSFGCAIASVAARARPMPALMAKSLARMFRSPRL